MSLEDSPQDQYVEGYNAQGRALERVPAAQLAELLRKTNKDKNDIDTQLADEQGKLQQIQNQLNQVNDDYLKKEGELRSLQTKKDFKLPKNRELDITEVMRDALDHYLERRPASMDEKRPVHVYFLSGEECGSALRIGREGAGSRDATFIVTLSQTVDSLARQAAKYWGLDPNKVFFLDRDGRIVQGRMLLADIILPPAEMDPAAASTSEPAASGGGGASSSTALALPGSGSALAKRGEASSQGYTVKGRDYILTLVRAKTVLTKEDLTVPPGDVLDDFTFDKTRLSADLEATRKKRGDPEVSKDKVTMDNIPSLWGLIEKGRDRKSRKMIDKRCRIFELLIFFIMAVFFVIVLQPENTWIRHMNYVGNEVQRIATVFSHKEQASVGIHNFSQISDRHQFNAWVDGPLNRTVFGGGLESRNMYMVLAQGRKFTDSRKVSLDLEFCPEGNVTRNATEIGNCTNKSSVNCTLVPPPYCYPSSLKQCPTKTVVELLTYAMAAGQPHIPQCEARYDKDPVLIRVLALFSVDAFSYVAGKISSYVGGNLTYLNTTDEASWNATISEFNPATPEAVPAKSIILVVYSPAVKGLYVTQFLTEFTPSGPLITSVRGYSINLDSGDTWQIVCYWICIFLSIIIVLMELRRITGFPERFYWEGKDRRDPCSVWTGLFVLVPILLVIAVSLQLKRMSRNGSVNLTTFTDHTLLSEKAKETTESRVPPFLARTEPYEWTVGQRSLWEAQNLLWYEILTDTINLVNLTVMTLLSVRYFLMYFPEMEATSMMVKQVVTPLGVTLLFLGFAFAGLGIAFYVILGSNIYDFRGPLSTFMSIIRLAHGGIMSWRDFYQDYPMTWWFLMLAIFIIFNVNLNNFAIAVMVSHKKEAQLHKNYSSHPFWQILAREKMAEGKNGGTSGLNPALAGFDFSSGKEVKVTEPPGQKI
jgi:hypothetical protein